MMVRLRSPQRGFTFFEILLVIAIATAITATGVVGLSRLQAMFKLRGTADEIRAQLQLARELAVANKDQLPYSVNLTAGILTLRGGTVEIARYQSPPGIIFSPETITFTFTSLTGEVTGCSSPCQLNLDIGDNREVVTIYENGIVN